MSVIFICYLMTFFWLVWNSLCTLGLSYSTLLRNRNLYEINFTSFSVCVCVCKCTVLGFCNRHHSQHLQQFHNKEISLCCLSVVKPSLCHQPLTTSVVFSPFLSFSVSWNITYRKACVNVMFGTGFFFWWHVLVIRSWSVFPSCDCCF